MYKYKPRNEQKALEQNKRKDYEKSHVSLELEDYTKQLLCNNNLIFLQF